MSTSGPGCNPHRIAAPDEQQQSYQALSGESGCEQAASARTFAANRFPQQWDHLQRELYAGPRMVEASAEDAMWSKSAS